jgi:DNA-directed RNA polymerase subunit RPC12/RpoP
MTYKCSNCGHDLEKCVTEKDILDDYDLLDFCADSFTFGMHSAFKSNRNETKSYYKCFNCGKSFGK